jgi:adenosine deaminase
MSTVLEALDALGARADEDYKVGADLAVLSLKHLPLFVAAVAKAEAAEQHFAKCSYELGACETATEDDESGVSCKEYLRLAEEATTSGRAALAALQRDIEEA